MVAQKLRQTQGRTSMTKPQKKRTGTAAKAEQELVDRLAKLERRLKIATVSIALAALVVASVSAYAGVSSWRTAKAQEQLAREAVAKAGANLEVSNLIVVFGKCGDADDPLTVETYIQNSGHMPGKVRGVFVQLEIELPDEQKKAHPRETLYSTVGQRDGQFVVEAQDSALVRIPINCENLRRDGIDARLTAEQMTAAIAAKSQKWFIWPFFTFGGYGAPQPVTHAVHIEPTDPTKPKP